jgi:8-oxo-dGTP diphosphatase
MRGDGDGWVECGKGHRHWGVFGAAGLLLRSPADRTDRIVLQHRASWSHHGDTWGLPGGARDSAETPVQAALREAGEEAAIGPAQVEVTGQLTDDHGGWAYTTVVGGPVGEVEPVPSAAETEAVRWLDLAEVDALPLHPGFAASWPRLRVLPPGLVLVVDGANVVGARGRGDGWWKDRAGATRRLRDDLAPLAAAGIAPADLPPGIAAADLPAGGAGPAGGSGDVDLLFPAVILVVEGVARPVADDDQGQVAVRAAAGSGDDEIVATAREARTAGRRVLAVTADRGLGDRLATAGVPRVGPRWLLARLESVR